VEWLPYMGEVPTNKQKKNYNHYRNKLKLSTIILDL